MNVYSIVGLITSFRAQPGREDGGDRPHQCHRRQHRRLHRLHRLQEQVRAGVRPATGVCSDRCVQHHVRPATGVCSDRCVQQYG